RCTFSVWVMFSFWLSCARFLDPICRCAQSPGNRFLLSICDDDVLQRLGEIHFNVLHPRQRFVWKLTAHQLDILALHLSPVAPAWRKRPRARRPFRPAGLGVNVDSIAQALDALLDHGEGIDGVGDDQRTKTIYERIRADGGLDADKGSGYRG